VTTCNIFNKHFLLNKSAYIVQRERERDLNGEIPYMIFTLKKKTTFIYFIFIPDK